VGSGRRRRNCRGSAGSNNRVRHFCATPARHLIAAKPWPSRHLNAARRHPGHPPRPPGPGLRAAGSSPRRAGRNVDTATHWPFTGYSVVLDYSCALAQGDWCLGPALTWGHVRCLRNLKSSTPARCYATCPSKPSPPASTMSARAIIGGWTRRSPTKPAAAVFRLLLLGLARRLKPTDYSVGRLALASALAER
jgi:hypothetical protein